MLLIIGQRNVEDIFFSLRLFYVRLHVLCLCLCECTPCKCRLPLRSEEDIRSPVAWTEESCEPRDMRAGSEPRSSGRTSALNFWVTVLTQYGHLKITGDTEIICSSLLLWFASVSQPPFQVDRMVDGRFRPMSSKGAASVGYDSWENIDPEFR